ncbi:hypothetical protein BS78_04G146700 [Paspalum vaginatum]|nr:hypothetical protein BS78_04G146700 [Paspalum vaginatum]
MPCRNSSQMDVADRRLHDPQRQGLVEIDYRRETIDANQETGATKRARWNHQMRLFLIDLLKEHDEAWTNIVCHLNTKFGTSFSLGQVKQKEQDLEKDYRSVKNLVAESGFGWDSERMMVDAPASVWATFAAHKNSKDALHWRDRSFPYFDALAPLYDGRHAEGRTRHGMDHYASKSKNASAPSTQASQVADTYQSPSPNPNLNTPSQSFLQFHFDEELEEANLDFSQRSYTPVQHTQVPPSSTQMPVEVPQCHRGKKQKSKSASPDDGFHERYLKLKKEEIDLFAAIEEKKLDDPYSINKCITMLEGLNGLQMGDILNREVFLSFSIDALRLAWITREIGRDQIDL